MGGILTPGSLKMIAGDVPSDRYRELFERSSDAILILAGERFIDCNQATVRMLRAHSRKQVLQTHPSELSPAVQPDGRESRDKANEMIARAFEHGNHRFEWVHRRVDGTDFPVEVLLTAVEREDSRRLHVVWRDISERKRLERDLRHTQKMEALGRLAGGIAHDFNNLLVSILGHSELLTTQFPDEPHIAAHVPEIRGAGERAAELVRQLMLFGRRDDPRTRVFDVRELVLQSRALLNRLIREDVLLDLRLGDAELRVCADSTQIQLILLNLASNARDAMPDGGRLSIELGRVCVSGDEIGPTHVPPGEYVRISVTDTGVGMDTETSRRAFEPFFTTKEVGQGTGLGLATVHGVVLRAGGEVTVDSAPKQGTTFQILLPRVEASIEAPAPMPSRGPRGQGELLLVVVEDERAVAELVSRVLKEAGYRVLLARDGVSALALAAQNPGVDLVLSDVIMPGMNGPQLLERLRYSGLNTRALLMSGYTGGAVVSGQGLALGVQLLEQPFSPTVLLQRVREVLDSAR